MWEGEPVTWVERFVRPPPRSLHSPVERSRRQRGGAAPRLEGGSVGRSGPGAGLAESNGTRSGASPEKGFPLAPRRPVGAKGGGVWRLSAGQGGGRTAPDKTRRCRLGGQLGGGAVGRERVGVMAVWTVGARVERAAVFPGTRSRPTAGAGGSAGRAGAGKGKGRAGLGPNPSGVPGGRRKSRRLARRQSGRAVGPGGRAPD